MLQLYPWQERGKSHMLKLIAGGATALLDASDTGTGKTITALAVMKELGVNPLIVSPKSVITPWTRAAEMMGVTPMAVLNVEKLKAGNTPYLKRGFGRSKWVWLLPPSPWIIWDEVQNASGYKSDNGKVLAMTRVYGAKVLMLSATAAESPLKMKAIGYLLGLHGYKDHFSWCLNHGCWVNAWNGLEFAQGKARIPALVGLHKQIFPGKGIRAKIVDIPEFPENSIQAEAYDLAEHRDAIDAVYAELSDALKRPENARNPLTVLLRARQQAELLKVPLISELVEDGLDEDRSMVVFVAFKETFAKLTGLWQCSKIYGGQSETDRTAEIDAFQSNRNRVCVVMIQAGGVGISLHDLTGEAPRESILTPGYNAIELKQALGRIHRVNAKSKAVQRIVFAAGTVEEKACRAVRRKLQNIELLNDGDLTEGVIQ